MFFNQPIKSVTIESDSLGSIKVKKVRNHIAYDQNDNPIDSNRFKPCQHLILGTDSDFEISTTPEKSADELTAEKSKNLDWIKNNPIAWEFFKKYNYGV
ncbi:hypothetical protein HC766_03825 [Candidatus Gracilibacteria bacterium]|nr:hypothetical protein [Thermales bacterium]NJS41462.1 hypothetical protein [Candidatus Gracilibacteria bacterium]